MQTKRRLLMLLAFPIAVLLAACGAATAPASGGSQAGSSAAAAAGKQVAISVHYPVGVSGPLTTIINRYLDEFGKENSTIKVTPVFDGDYLSTIAKVQQLVQAGTPPDVAIVNAAGIYTMIDANAVVPLDGFHLLSYPSPCLTCR